MTGVESAAWHDKYYSPSLSDAHFAYSYQDTYRAYPSRNGTLAHRTFTYDQVRRVAMPSLCAATHAIEY